MPQKIWTVGEEVLAADFNTYVQNQVVPTFPTTAARDAWASPPEGALSVTTDSDRCWQYNGTAWIRTGWYSSAGRTWFDANAQLGSVPPSSITPLTWSTETSDSDGFASGGTTITIPAGLGGIYLINMIGAFGANPGNAAFVRIGAAGGGANKTADGLIGPFSWSASASLLMALNAADQITGSIYQNTAGALTLGWASIRVTRLAP